MILPGNYITTLILLILGMFCFGSWAATFKSAGPKWRFELYYFDFAIGIFLAATILALTFGSFGFDGFSFTDDLRLAGKRQDLLGFLAGAVFNLGNMFLVAALSLAEMSVVFPIGMGFAMVVGLILNDLFAPAGNKLFLFAGAALVFIAVVLAVFVFSQHAAAKQLEAMRAGKTRSTRRGINWKAAILGLLGGVFLGSFFPLIDLARAGENGLGPYSVGWMFALGALITTFIYNLFFMNLPVQGKPIDISDFFKARLTVHLRGLLGGILSYVAVVAGLVGARAEGAAQVQPFVAWGLGQLGIVVAVLWGILNWKEFSDASSGVKIQLAFMLAFLIVGIGLASGGMIAASQ
jgi:glucose uptake protein